MSKTNSSQSKKKKKLISVEGLINSYSTKFTSGLAFALVSPPDQGRKQTTHWATCREGLYNAVKTFLHEESGSAYVSGNGGIDINKLRLLLHRDCGTEQAAADFKGKLFSGKKILNIYEKVAGWVPSKITTVNHNDKNHVWLLTGPKEWMSSPHLLSMLCLIMRITTEYGPFDVKNINEVQKLWQKLIKNGGNSDINTYLAASHNYFPVIVKHYKTLFTDIIKRAYSDPESVGFRKGGGIHSLCKGESINKRLQTALEAQMRKEK